MIIQNPDFINRSRNVAPEDSDITIEQQQNMPLLAKIPGLQVDIEKLNWHFQNVVKQYEPVYTRTESDKPLKKYGGWSVTSQTGDYRDGWDQYRGQNNADPLTRYKNNWRPRWFFDKKTQICTGYLNEVVDMVNDMGFVTRGIRIWDNPIGGHHIGWHTDGPSNVYSVRLHIPIVTNPDCVHVWATLPEETRIHIPADGSTYLFRTNVTHDTFNYGTTERYHLIFETWDVKGIVPGFKYEYDIGKMAAEAEKWVADREAELAREQGQA